MTYTKGPRTIGNPPKAGELELEVDWANCIGARSVVTSVYELSVKRVPIVPPLKTYSQTYPQDWPNGTWLQTFNQLPSGKTVQFVTEVRDKNGAVIKSTQSNPVAVP